jgi:hypothetical protein
VDQFSDVLNADLSPFGTADKVFLIAPSVATTQANRYFSLPATRISVVPYRSSMGWTAIRTDLLLMDIAFDDPKKKRPLVHFS